tara:strand:- start:889 stop:1308 length:420 start_codon:yes stop_codon:yes gene_type:complete
MIDIKKLKKGDRLQFGKDTFAMVTNFEDNISNLKGTIETIDEDVAKCIWVKLDEPNRHFNDYNNCVQFALVEDGSGSHISYLEKADLLFNYEIEQTYTQTDYFNIVEGRNKEEAIEVCFKEDNIRDTRQEETETTITKI